MKRAELNAIRSEVEQHLRESPPAPASTELQMLPQITGYHRAAAVLAAFDPSSLKPYGDVGDATIDDLLFDSEPLAQRGKELWSLLYEVRKLALTALGDRPALQRARAANPGQFDDVLQQVYDTFIQGDPPPLEQMNASQIAAAITVIDWLEAVVDKLPDLASLRGRYAWLSFLQPFEELAGPHFRGRARELEQLRNYVGVLPPDSIGGYARRVAEAILDLQKKPALMIVGPGGVGKSTLVARFILDHIGLPAQLRFPFAYINFDRPSLLVEEPLTVLVESVRQLGLQYPEYGAYCERVRTDWQDRLNRQAPRILAARAADRYTTIAVDTFSPPSLWKGVLENFASLLRNIKADRAPFLFVLDTFEEVQYHSPAMVDSFCEFLMAFQEQVPRLRTVIAGRAELTEAPYYPVELLRLREFDSEAAVGFLEAQGVTPPALAQAMVRQVGSNPLSLKLAVDVWKQEGELPQGITNLRDPSIFGLRVNANALQGQLVVRYLEHIHNPDVRKLAYPGLVLRRITPELILKVLAEPCHVQVASLAEADRLYQEMAREVALVQEADGALYHRVDVRQLMIGLLRSENPALVQSIEEAAVDYYAARDGADKLSERAEEIYHRLALHQPLNAVESRWVEGVERYLYSVVEEFDGPEQIWLASRVGVSLTSEQRVLADLQSWERDTKRDVIEHLQTGGPEGALKRLGERPSSQWSDGSDLFLLAVQALEQSKQFEEAATVVDEGVVSMANAGNRNGAVELRLAGARIDLNRGEPERARVRLDEAALLVTDREADLLYNIEIGLYRLALDRAKAATPLAELATKVNADFTRLSDRQVMESRQLMGWLAGDLGVEFPDIIQRVLIHHALPTDQQPLLRELSLALSAWDAQLSKKEGSRGLLAATADLKRLGTLTETWNAFVLSTDAQTLTQRIADLLRKVQPAPERVWVALAALLREFAPPVIRSGTVPEPQSIPVELEPSDPPPLFREHKVPEPRSMPVELQPARLTRLTRKMFRQLTDALIDAFPSYDALHDMVRFRLNVNLEAIALVTNEQTVIIKLVEWAEANGRLVELLGAARRVNPGNPRLFELAQKFGLTLGNLPDESKLSKLLNAAHGGLDINQWRNKLGILEAQICRIEIRGDLAGTGFLIGSDLVISSADVLGPLLRSESDPRDLAIRFDYRRLSDGVTTDNRIIPLVRDGQLVVHNRELDYIVIQVGHEVGLEPIGGGDVEVDYALRNWIALPETPSVPDPGAPLIVLYQENQGLMMGFDSDGMQEVRADGTRLHHRLAIPNTAAGAPCFDINLQLVALQSRSGDGQSEAVLIGAIKDDIKDVLRRMGLSNLLGGEVR